MIAATVTPISVRRAVQKFGTDVQTWRKLRGLTAEQVADRAGISRPTLRKLEHGSGNVSLEITLRVLRALGIMDVVVNSADPLRSDLGRLRSEEALPKRVRQPRAKVDADVSARGRTVGEA